MLQAGVLASDAELMRSGNGGGSWRVMGDPTEAALVVAAAKASMQAPSLRHRCQRVAEIPFSSQRQWMAVWVKDPTGALQVPLAAAPVVTGKGPASPDLLPVLIAKGAPEAILPRCERWLDGAGITALTAPQRDWWLEQARSLAGTGLRVLALACSPNHPGPHQEVTSLVLLGLMAQLDPARPEVPDAVARCHRAGIRPVMITGDHPLTARRISERIGLVAAPAPGAPADVVLGRDLERLDDVSLSQVVARARVYARVAPEQKLRIVRALQAHGEVVAMTGDGVNDAPALKQAHIGVAMGISGSDVSRDAADVVLLDDNFATIVNAVEEGRLVYANIRRFVRYVLGCNLGELITIGSAPFLGLALTPLQILWINLVTDGVPALALALEPGEADLMHRSPIDPAESIFARGTGGAILRIGLVFGSLVVGLMLLAAHQGRPWQTMAFTTLCLAQLAHALSARSERPLFQLPPFSNPWLLAAVIASGLLQLTLLYVPPLASFFGIVPLSAADLALCGAVSMAFLLYLELDKLVIQASPNRRSGNEARECDS